jgi:predicted phospho-2-dehydro-3-deoxyheptonate aldolase
MVGKAIRLERIIDRSSKRTIIIPLDHGTTLGPIPGLQDMKKIMHEVVEGGANAVVLHKGMVKAGHRGSGRDIGLIVHLSGSTILAPDPNHKVLVCSVEEAIQLGADGVSIHINLGAEDEALMLSDFGEVTRACERWGMPLLAMIYTRGEKIKNQFEAKYVKHAARVGAELGADVVKVNYTGSVESFAEVVSGCPVPVVIAGGEKMESEEELLMMVEGALKAGASGVSIGRNIFQHKYPIRMLKAIAKLVHERCSLSEAKEELRKER